MVHRGLNIRLYYQYMENLARMHEDIAHDPASGRVRFTRMFLDEFLSDKQVKLDGTGPCLMVEPYEARLIDNKSNNILSERVLAFSVVAKPGKRMDRSNAVDLQAQCENIALEILGRIYNERRKGANPPFQNVLMHEAEDNPIDQALDGGWIGWRVQIPVQNTVLELKYDPGRWNDDAAAPLLYDLTNLSCANLNHPTLGLTAAQRTNCLYVTIYEADGVTERTRIMAGGSYTLTEADDMDIFVRKANKAAALADDVTVVTTQQFLLIEDTNELRPGDGGTVAALAATDVYLLPVKGESGRLGVNGGGSSNYPYELQVNKSA